MDRRHLLAVAAGGAVAFALPNATDMFTSVVVLSAAGIALVTLIRRVERRLLRWAPGLRA